MARALISKSCEVASDARLKALEAVACALTLTSEAGEAEEFYGSPSFSAPGPGPVHWRANLMSNVEFEAARAWIAQVCGGAKLKDRGEQTKRFEDSVLWHFGYGVAMRVPTREQEIWKGVKDQLCVGPEDLPDDAELGTRPLAGTPFETRALLALFALRNGLLNPTPRQAELTAFLQPEKTEENPQPDPGESTDTQTTKYQDLLEDFEAEIAEMITEIPWPHKHCLSWDDFGDTGVILRDDPAKPKERTAWCIRCSAISTSFMVGGALLSAHWYMHPFN